MADAEERRTRETYAAWMRRGMEVVTELAARPTGTGWPDDRPVGDLPWSAWSREAYRGPDRAAAEAALANGWLVAAQEHPRPDRAGRLAGLTVAVKDIIDVAGLPTRNGTPGALWGEPADSASAWRALADAGARCVGKAATHEMAWGVTTPQIANPRAPERIAGGSSGGSAACVASGAALGALGTDTGGSIRIPAALCGVVGFRPTTGAVASSGVLPLAPEQDVPGPLAADVATCVAMLEVLLGRGLGYAGRGIDDLRIGVLAEPGRLEPEVRGAYEGAVETLRAAGATVVPYESTAHRRAASISLVTMLLSSARLHAAAVRADPAGFGGEARALLTVGDVRGADAAPAHAARAALRAETARMFRDARLDAFMTPTVPCTAPRRGADTVRIGERDEPVAAALTRFTAWASVAAMPAVSVPVPTRELPAAVQVMAPPHHEQICARLAHALQISARP